MTAAGLPPDLLERVLTEAFPFHLVVDGHGCVTRVGRSLSLACPALRVGSAVSEHLRMTTPRGARWSTRPLPTGLVLVSAVDGPLVLRGQLLPAGDGLLLLGAPWITSMDDLPGLGLRLSDFAAADPVTDLLMMFGAQASALADAQLLAAQLEQAAIGQAYEANHDALTGLANRTAFTSQLETQLLAASAGGGSVGVVLLDLDRFKEINDTLGHDCGDEVLRQVGPRIASVLRSGELTARLGGDEFALLVTCPERGTSATDACWAVAQRVVEAIRDPFVVDDLTLVVEVSAGIAVAPCHGERGELLMQHADVAMYRAKSSHEGVATYSQDLDDHDPRRLALLSQLRAAVEDGDLVLHYQPLLDIATNRVLGVEALVRWQHRQEGLLPPSDFVPLAETSGLIHRLTRAVLQGACEQAKRWAEAGTPLVVSVNVSARCLMDATLPITVEDTLLSLGLSADLLKLEITESAIIADPERAQSVIRHLQSLGVALSIDDFGTGYTSLAYLRELPVQELKIDRSFVTSMLSEPKNAAIVRTGVELASRLGLESVAEGVEDAATLTALAALGCTTAQGYHLARPMPAGSFTSWLADWSEDHPAMSRLAS